MICSIVTYLPYGLGCARGMEAEILLFFFLKKQKIEADSPTRRGAPFFYCILYFVYCILYVVVSLYVVCCMLYVVCCMLYVVCCTLRLLVYCRLVYCACGNIGLWEARIC